MIYDFINKHRLICLKEMMFTIETLRRDGMPIWNHWTVESIAEESDASSIISIDDCYFINNEQPIHYAQIHDHQIEYDQFAESIDVEVNTTMPESN